MRVRVRYCVRILEEKILLYYAIDFTNSRPQIIALFSKFLREILKVDIKRLRGQFFLYPDHNVKQLISYWSTVSDLPVTQFQKIILLKQKNSKYKPNPRGTFKLRYSSKEAFLKLQDIIEVVWKDAGVSEMGNSLKK